MDFVAGTAGQEVRMRTGPGENAGADSLWPRAVEAADAAGEARTLPAQRLPRLRRRRWRWRGWRRPDRCRDCR